jgi:hypothetical protein
LIMAATSPRRSSRASVLSTLSKVAKPATSPVKARPTRQTVAKTPKYLDKVKIEDEEEEIELSSEDEKSTAEESKSDSSINVDSEEEDEEDYDDDEDEDDREIQRIIEKTAEETQNIAKTARQRAKGHKKDAESEEELLSLPMSKPLTEEQLLKKSEKSRRRKMQRELKLEETKRATIDRLLTKQRGGSSSAAEKQAKEDSENSPEMKASLPDPKCIPEGFVRYIDSGEVSLLIVPQGSELFAPVLELSKSDLSCSVCKGQSASYKHPSSLKPFCSVSCYKNLK